MIVDSSALVAIIKNEADVVPYAAALADADHAAISAVNYVEAAVVVDSAHDPVASRRFDELIDYAGIDVVAVTAEHAVIARQAYRDFGPGSGNPARLNFGDCFAYALATTARKPLLFKGSDFIHTDLVAAYLPTE